MQIDVTDYAHAITNQEQTVAAVKARADQAVADEGKISWPGQHGGGLRFDLRSGEGCC
jgi:hypothetical protein